MKSRHNEGNIPKIIESKSLIVSPTSLIHPIIKKLLETLDFTPGFIDKNTENLSQPIPLGKLLLKYGKFLPEKRISEKLLENRCIVGDIVFNSKDRTTKFYCKYGSSTFVDNINSFTSVCTTHAFFPVVDRIIIDGFDITEIETLNDIFKNVIMEIDNPVLKSILINEIQKIEKNFDMLLKLIKEALETLTVFTTSTTQFILGKNFEKTKNIGALSENLFVEIAIRLENRIRDMLGFESSYIQVAGYKDDIQRKTDMYYFYKGTTNGDYKKVPVQFTYGKKSKEYKVEQYLVEHKDEHRERCFMIISVQGKFKEYILNDNLLGKYNDWLDNPKEREIVTNKRFPLFIDLVDQKIIQPAEIIYIALHIICREEFKIRHLEGKGFIWDKRGEMFLRNKKNSINGINLNKISIEYIKCGEELENSKNTKKNKKNKKNVNANDINLGSISKRKYIIKYDKTKIGTIVMYDW